MMFLDKFGEVFSNAFSVGSCSHEDNRAFRLLKSYFEFRKHFLVDSWSPYFPKRSIDTLYIHLFMGDIFREFYSDNSWAF